MSAGAFAAARRFVRQPDECARSRRAGGPRLSAGPGGRSPGV